jgi:hypothetical protein
MERVIWFDVNVLLSSFTRVQLPHRKQVPVKPSVPFGRPP